MCVLVKVQIRFGKIWGTELTGFFIPLRTEGGNRELPRSKGSIKKCALRRPLVVAADVRIIKSYAAHTGSVAIGIKIAAGSTKQGSGR